MEGDPAAGAVRPHGVSRDRRAPLLLTLPGYAFYWFSLEPPPSGAGEEEAAAYVPPPLACRSAEALLLGDERPTLEDALGDFLATRRWFGGRGYRLTGVRIEEAVALAGVYVLIARVEYANRETERYVLLLATVTEARYMAPHAIVASLALPGQDATLVDALEDGPSARALLSAVVGRARAEGSGGTIDAEAFTELHVPEGEPVNISAQHAAASIRYGDRYLLKMFRRLDEGESPELELGRFLNARAPGLTPEVVGAMSTAACAPSRARSRCCRLTCPTRAPPGSTRARSCAATSSAC